MQTSYFRSAKRWAARLGVYFPKNRATDAALLAAVARGDRKSLDRLYRRYAPALRYVAKTMLGSAAEAEDLLHDVFQEAWEKAGSYQPERASVGTWLLVRLRSRALDRKKSPRYARTLSLHHVKLDAEQTASGDNPAANYLNLVARRNLAALPGGQRQLLQLLFYRDLSATEVADELNIPVGTVKSRLAQTLVRLRRDAARAATG